MSFQEEPLEERVWWNRRDQAKALLSSCRLKEEAEERHNKKGTIQLRPSLCNVCFSNTGSDETAAAHWEGNGGVGRPRDGVFHIHKSKRLFCLMNHCQQYCRCKTSRLGIIVTSTPLTGVTERVMSAGCGNSRDMGNHSTSHTVKKDL